MNQMGLSNYRLDEKQKKKKKHLRNQIFRTESRRLPLGTSSWWPVFVVTYTVFRLSFSWVWQLFGECRGGCRLCMW